MDSMSELKKMAIIGSPESILPFKAIGLDEYPASNSSAALHLLEEAIKKEYGIIYIEEAYAREFADKINELNKELRSTTISIIPGTKGSIGFVGENIRALVKRAIGIDIFAEK